MREIVAALVLGLLTTSSALSKDIAICRASEGYSFFPNVGQGKPGRWEQDSIKAGRFTSREWASGSTCYWSEPDHATSRAMALDVRVSVSSKLLDGGVQRVDHADALQHKGAHRSERPLLFLNSNHLRA